MPLPECYKQNVPLAPDKYSAIAINIIAVRLARMTRPGEKQRRQGQHGGHGLHKQNADLH